MKIVEIIPQLGQGGAEKFVVDLCNELVENNDVTLIVLNSIDKSGFFKDLLGSRIKIICLDKKPGLDISLFAKLRKVIKGIAPDIVHTHLRALIYTTIFDSKIKFFHTVHNDAKAEAGDKLSIIFRKIAFKKGKVTPIAISEESRESFIGFYGITPKMIYNGSTPYTAPDKGIQHMIAEELNSLKKDKSSIMMLNIARLQPQKNQIALAKAIDDLNSKGHKVDLSIIGSLNDLKIKADIEAIKSPHIHMLGTRTNPRDYMVQADAFCLSSIYEGMPITLIECFSVGAIPICTPVGGIKNMIHDGVNGILAKSSDQHDIEEAILRFLDMTDSDKSQMKQESLKSFRKYSMKDCAAKYLELFES